MILMYLAILDSEEDQYLFTDIYERYERRMYPVAYGILKEQHRAEDAVHDAFLNIIKHFEKCKVIPSNEIEAWIVTIVRNISLNYLKKDNRLDGLEDFELWAIPAPENTESATGYGRLLEIILSMPEHYRSLLELKYVLEWSNVEIAKHFGTNENAVGAKIFRARKKLLETLEREGYYDEEQQPV